MPNRFQPIGMPGLNMGRFELPYYMSGLNVYVRTTCSAFPGMLFDCSTNG
jgi:hypothetical protein